MLQLDRTELLACLKPLLGTLKKKSDVDKRAGALTYHNSRFYCQIGDYKLSACALASMKGTAAFALDGADFVVYLQKCKVDALNLEVGKMIEVKCGRSKTKITTREQSAFSTPSKWGSLGGDFVSTFDKVSKVTARDLSNPVLTTVHVAGWVMEATDMDQLIRVVSSDEFICEDVLIPALSNPFIKALAPTQYRVEDNKIFFRNEEGVILSCPLFGGHFPDYQKTLKVGGEKVRFSKNIAETVDRCAVFLRQCRFDEEKKFRVELRSNRAYLYSGSQFGFSEEAVKASYPKKFEGHEFQISPGLFEECVSHGYKVLLTDKNIQVKTDLLWYVAMLRC